ncbi:hypothetical protein ACLMJK_000460 [Lecanora helva]
MTRPLDDELAMTAQQRIPIQLGHQPAAQTVLHVVNAKDNSTRTTTVTNSEVDLTNHTQVKETNSAGTRTATVVLTTSNTISTHTVTFPSIFYADYPSSYALCGTYPTTISGASTCIKYPCDTVPAGSAFWTYTGAVNAGAPKFAYPSHPPVLQTASQVAITRDDTQGLAYEPVWGAAEDFQRVIDLFPDLQIWSCRGAPQNAPAETKNTARYLTATSTSTESDAVNTSPLTSKITRSDPDDSISEAAAVASAQSFPVSQTARAPALPSSSIKKAASVQTSMPARTASDSGNAATKGTEEPDAEEPTARMKPSPQQANPDKTSLKVAPAASASADFLRSQNDDTTATVETAPNPNANLPTLDHGLSLTASPPGVLHTSNGYTLPVVGSSIPSQPTHQNGSPNPPVLSLGSHVIAANPKSQYIFESQTLALGSPITLGSGSAATSVMLQTANSQTFLVVGSSSTVLPANPTAAPKPPVFSLGSHIITADSKSQFILGSQTLAPNSPIIVGTGSAGTSVLLQVTNSQTLLVVGSSTSVLPANPTATPLSPVLSLGSHVITANSQNQYVLESQTLALDSPITFGSGSAATPIMLQTTNSQTVLIVGSSTSTLAASPTAGVTDKNAPEPLTIGNQAVTLESMSDLIVGSQTLTPGAAITVSGTPISLAPSGKVVVGSSTEVLGSYIMNGFGAAESSISGSSDNQSDESTSTSSEAGSNTIGITNNPISSVPSSTTSLGIDSNVGSSGSNAQPTNLKGAACSQRDGKLVWSSITMALGILILVII